MQHIIHRQKIIIKTRAAGNGSGWQQKIDAGFQQNLLQRLDPLFDALAPPDKIWRIETLHLRLGTTALEGFDERFIGQVVEGCRNALLGIADPRVSQVAAVIKETRVESSLEELLFFLDTGRLPWHSSVKDIARWEAEIIASFGVAEWSALIRWLRKTLAPDAVSGMLTDLGLRPGLASPALQRLIHQFSDTLLIELLRRGPGAGAEATAIAFADAPHSAGRVERWELLLTSLLFSSQDTGRTGRPETVRRPADPGPDRRRDRDGETLYLDSCGLVLLHPFLELYFAELGLLSARRFRNEDAAGRAVLLLHWLATGRAEAAEFELGLQKLLCGLQLESVLPQHLELSPDEQAESEHVLRSMLGHWPPLKNTSIDGLRSSFLQRPGKLVAKEAGWQLTIEKQTIDLLLARLPWGFSTIRLPWMEGVLGVDWC